MNEIIPQARALVGELSSVIQEQTEEGDPLKLEELLGLNDQLLGLLKKVNGRLRQGLKLHGLGLGLGEGGGDGLEGKGSGDGKLDGFPHINGRSNGNGHVIEMENLSPSSSSFSEELNSSLEGEEAEEKQEEEEEEEEEDPTTPKVDKGKRRAEPEPEQPEMVLSPKTFMMGEPEREDSEKRRRRGGGGGGGYLDDDDERGVGVVVVSPSDRSRILVEEEGEVFRKGIVLLGPEEMDGDYAGEDLRREVCVFFFFLHDQYISFFLQVTGCDGRTSTTASSDGRIRSRDSQQSKRDDCTQPDDFNHDDGDDY